ncbi:hypothetical protein EAI_04162 [Harpegnathos saltator]|uniref:Mutator-like transposase domain-containing protein n=1 Tax=Harpegnathos saltator TaxID=610380 RepID=E2BR83_HARSA|nr:hypothetical protein EAI_04162 [Harpegnathos saltator]
MEADTGADLINNSKILHDTGLNVLVVIGDEDSSTIAAVRKGNPYKIYKLADKNHLKKNFGKELYDLAKFYKELNKTGVIKHIKKCFSYAIAQNKGKSVSTEDIEDKNNNKGLHAASGSKVNAEQNKRRKKRTLITKTKKSKAESEEEDPDDFSCHDDSSTLETFSDLENDLSNREEDRELVPGQITKVKKNGAIVKSMVKTGKAWKWPDGCEDILYYEWNDILSHIKEPKKVSKTRKLYRVLELDFQWG